VLIFPEGTRTRDGSVGRFKRGFLMLVEQTGAPVLPVAIEGAHDVWPVGRSLPRLGGPILVEAAPETSAGDLLRDGPEAAIERVRRAIDEARASLRREIDAWALRRCEAEA
jgi:1-acyl-sn-glycerol-3-phosphate acyltransferase